MSECEIIVKMDKHIKIKGGTYKQDLIRCKDCKYLDKGENDSESWCECTAHFGKYFDVDENDFCSYGERKDEGL